MYMIKYRKLLNDIDIMKMEIRKYIRDNLEFVCKRRVKHEVYFTDGTIFFEVLEELSFDDEDEIELRTQSKRNGDYFYLL